MIDINYCSQKGLCDTNQDFILCKQLQDGSCIAILADGMGGLQYGEIAAATVAQSIYKILAEHNSVDIRELLVKAFEQADIAVADKCKALCCKMGAAVIVLYIKMILPITHGKEMSVYITKKKKVYINLLKTTRRKVIIVPF